ncbi:XRE family transcriptional regulator [Vibrio kasasachensis]|uniref:helix-turn-helix domain-containing protein n=1 Tax=Vibrio kasasachensis TaxID=2910248 RepID=UPI003D0FC787
MNDSVFKSEIANHLKYERKKKGLSLDATSKLTGVSKAMLGQIEREESSPTISTLWKISSGLETSFSAFFANSPELLSSQQTFPEDGSMKVNTVFPYKADSGMEMFEITLTEHHRQMSSAHGVGVIEHVLVLSGQLNVYFDNQWHPLYAGERLRFLSDQPHGYEAISETAIFQNIVCYPR